MIGPGRAAEREIMIDVLLPSLPEMSRAERAGRQEKLRVYRLYPASRVSGRGPAGRLGKP
jgi:hypothetical protein